TSPLLANNLNTPSTYPIGITPIMEGLLLINVLPYPIDVSVGRDLICMTFDFIDIAGYKSTVGFSFISGPGYSPYIDVPGLIISRCISLKLIVAALFAICLIGIVMPSFFNSSNTKINLLNCSFTYSLYFSSAVDK